MGVAVGAAGDLVDLVTADAGEAGAEHGVDQLGVGPLGKGLGGGETVGGYVVGAAESGLHDSGEVAGGAGEGRGAVVGEAVEVTAAGMDAGVEVLVEVEPAVAGATVVVCEVGVDIRG